MNMWELIRDRKEIAESMAYVWPEMKRLYAKLYQNPSSLEKIRLELMPLMQEGDRLAKKFNP